MVGVCLGFMVLKRVLGVLGALVKVCTEACLRRVHGDLGRHMLKLV